MYTRRKFLAAPLALAAPAALACSNPPVGRWSPELTEGSCEPTWIGDLYPEYYAAINTFNMVAGATQVPPGTRLISGLNDPSFRAQLQPGEFSDISELADLISVGGLAGGYFGYRRGGSRGAAVGALVGGGVAAIMWMGYNLGVVGMRMSAPGPFPPGASYNGWGAGAYYPQGTFGIPFGGGQWFTIDFNYFGGGGGSTPWCVRLY